MQQLSLLDVVGPVRAPRRPRRAPAEGRALAEAGMARTLNAEQEDWKATAIADLVAFAKRTPPEFTTEGWRMDRSRRGMPEPHDHHVWGAVTTLAAKRGLIVFTGRYRPAVASRTHGHPVKVWRLPA